jgi:hypothetical protein
VGAGGGLPGVAAREQGRRGDLVGVAVCGRRMSAWVSWGKELGWAQENSADFDLK